MSTENCGNNNQVIYILTNPSFPEYIKIGYACDVDRRLSELNNTPCTPFAFRIFATYEVSKGRADKFLHKIIDTIDSTLRSKDTLNGKERIKEFFEMDPEDAYLILDNIAQLTNTEDKLHRYAPNEKDLQEEEAASKIREKVKKKRFSFSKCKIDPDSMITLVGHPDITARVVDERHVEYDGEIWLLSPLTGRLLDKDAIQGAAYWTYNGRKLTDIREELEEQDSGI